MKVLVACEESQEVCKAFRELGHEAYSCDIQKPSGGHSEWHILGDALEAIKGGSVTTMDGQVHSLEGSGKAERSRLLYNRGRPRLARSLRLLRYRTGLRRRWR